GGVVGSGHQCITNCIVHSRRPLAAILSNRGTTKPVDSGHGDAKVSGSVLREGLISPSVLPTGCWRRVVPSFVPIPLVCQIALLDVGQYVRKRAALHYLRAAAAGWRFRLRPERRRQFAFGIFII